MSEEENWYNSRSSGVKSGGQKTRRVWGSSPNTAGTSVTPANTRGSSAKKQNGKYYRIVCSNENFSSWYSKLRDSLVIIIPDPNQIRLD